MARLALIAALIPLVVLLACAEERLEAQPAFGGRVFDFPVDLIQHPDGGYLLAEKGGLVRSIDAAGRADVVLDLSDRIAQGHEELGLLSIALDPAFEEVGALWAHYIAGAADDGSLRNVIARYVLAEGSVSEVVVLEVPQPFENHNGGGMRFGPDQMLYVSIGDGGDAFDPLGSGQDLGTLLGTIVRIDARTVGQGGTYAVPGDNPFVGVEGARPEIWAYGLRNPWRFAFDPVTGDLWAGDVGQDRAEEVNLIHAGGNYGWSAFEGDDCRVASCDGIDSTLPVASYTHEDGCAITGGFVYRADALPLEGEYLYGDLCRGTIWAIEPGESPRVIAEVDGPIVSFAEGHDGEVFIVRFGHPIVQLTR